MGEEWVTIPRHEYEALKALVEHQRQEIEALQAEIRLLKSGRDSSTSSTPPSADIGRSNRQSLREKSGKKSGGQPGHPGHTLPLTETPDKILRHSAPHCKDCGASLEGVAGTLAEKRQVVTFKIQKIYTEHQRLETVCPHCGTANAGAFPAGVKAPIQYGAEAEAFVGYLSVYQYMPYNRIAQMVQEVFGLTLTEGTIDRMLKRLKARAATPYAAIKAQLEASAVVGSDETGCHVNGKGSWLFTVQNRLYTYLFHALRRSYDALKAEFPQGFPQGTLVSDRYAAQLKVAAKTHQLCCVHLLRDLNKFIKALDSAWARAFKANLKQALALKRRMTSADYEKPPPLVAEIERETDRLLAEDSSLFHATLKAFIKQITKYREYLYRFLYEEAVPFDNNGSERSIRNMKVKTKISGQFRTEAGADCFVVLRSVVDTAIKHGQTAFQAFSELAISTS